jgi:phosphoglycerate kinase
MKEKIENSRFIVWNGPLGKYEEGYTQGTIGLTKILAESNKEVIIGGGDTLAVIKHLEVKLPSGSLTSLFDKFTYVSTGGGAMLEFLATGTLSGIEALD